MHNRPSSCPRIDSFKEAPSLCLPVVHEARGDQVRSHHGGRCVCLPLPVHQLSKVFIANPSVGAASPSHENDSWFYQSTINNYIGINPIIVVSRGITTSVKREATAKSSGVTLIGAWLLSDMLSWALIVFYQFRCGGLKTCVGCFFVPGLWTILLLDRILKPESTLGTAI